jgi:hypothetical protein
MAALQHLKEDLKTQIDSQNKTKTNEPSGQKVDTSGNKLEDNMSLSEIIAEKYKSNIKVNKLKSPEEAAQVLIKDTKSFDVNDQNYTEGTADLQQKYQEKLGPIETNLSKNWKDLSDVKQRLW